MSQYLFQLSGLILMKYMTFKDKHSLNFSYKRINKESYSEKPLNFISFIEISSLPYGGKTLKNIYHHQFVEKIFQEMLALLFVYTHFYNIGGLLTFLQNNTQKVIYRQKPSVIAVIYANK